MSFNEHVVPTVHLKTLVISAVLRDLMIPRNSVQPRLHRNVHWLQVRLSARLGTNCYLNGFTSTVTLFLTVLDANARFAV
jgi:hypothetical protein